MGETGLHFILKEYPKVWESPKQFQALLMDIYPKDKLLRNLLMTSVYEQIPHEMRSSSEFTGIEKTKYAKRIVEAHGCSLEKALEIVTLWIDALEISEESINIQSIGLSRNDKGSNNQNLEKLLSLQLKDVFIHNVKELQYFLVTHPITGMRKLRTGELKNLLNDDCPRIALACQKAMFSIQEGKEDQWIIYQRFVETIAPIDKSKRFLIRFGKCFLDESSIYSFFATMVNKYPYLNDKGSVLGELIGSGFVSEYLDTIDCNNSIIKQCEKEYCSENEEDKLLAIYRIAILNKKFRNECMEEFKGLGNSINKALNASLNEYDFLCNKFCGSVRFYRLVALFLYCNNQIEAPRIERNNKRELFETILSSLTKGGQPYREPKRLIRKSEPVLPLYKYTKTLVVKSFSNIYDPNMFFCPEHECQLYTVKIRITRFNSGGDYKELPWSYRYCKECNSIVTNPNIKLKETDGITYLYKPSSINNLSKKKRIICKECGQIQYLSLPEVAEYERQGVLLPIRCQQCESRYSTLKHRFPSGIIEWKE